MTDWLIAQQASVSIVLLLLMASGKWLSGRIGAVRQYRLWLLLPTILVANNLPVDLLPQSATHISQYVVGMTPTTSLPKTLPLFAVWFTAGVLIFAWGCFQHWRLTRSICCISDDNYGCSVHYSNAVSSPLLLGVFRPRILLPVNFAELFSRTQQQLIIRHEQVHLQRGDGVWNCLAFILFCVFWFNPLIWLAVHSFRMSQELACDETVLFNSSKAIRIDYARALVQCASINPYNTTLYPTLGDKQSMTKRLAMIKKPANVNKRLAGITLLAALVLTGNTALAKRQQPVTTEDDKINLATPVMRVDPIYPQQAAAENIEGKVVLRFDITATGTTENIAVIETSPAGIFDESARIALAQWQYKPRIQNGKALPQHDFLVQLDYELGPEPERIIVRPDK